MATLVTGLNVSTVLLRATMFFRLVSLVVTTCLQFNIGSSTCPEGDVEVTAERLKTRSMIDKLKQAGKL